MARTDPWDDIRRSPQERIDALKRDHARVTHQNDLMLEFIGVLFWRLHGREGSPEEYGFVSAGESLVEGEGRGLEGAEGG